MNSALLLDKDPAVLLGKEVLADERVRHLLRDYVRRRELEGHGFLLRGFHLALNLNKFGLKGFLINAAK